MTATAALVLTAFASGQAPTAGTRVVPYPIDLPPEFQEAIRAGTRTQTGRPGPKYWTNLAHYDLAITLDVPKKRVTGKAHLTYENRSPDRLSRLVLHAYQDLMKPSAQRTRTIVPTNGFELASIAVNGLPAALNIVVESETGYAH